MVLSGRQVRLSRELASGRLGLLNAGRRILALRVVAALVRRGFGLSGYRLAVRVEQLDLRRVVQLADRLAFRLLGDVACGLILDLFERRGGLGANGLPLGEMAPRPGADA